MGWPLHWAQVSTALYSDLWTRDKCQLHINVLELRAVTLLHLEQDILSQTILIESDNTAVSYINRQGGGISKILNDEACSLFEWFIPRSIRVRAIYRPGINNELANFLLHNCPDP